MKKIIDQEFGGERPLFATNDLSLERVTFELGESPLKECRNIEAHHCLFKGKYPFWHNENIVIEDSHFEETSRAAIWYVKNLQMRRTHVEAPKMFREIDGLVLEKVELPHAAETCWNCRNVNMLDVKVEQGDYFMTNGENIKAERFYLQGNYSFQYAKNVEIANSDIHSKDAFWHSYNVTVRDSHLDGEYLGWHSHNLHLINCTISGTQALCYTHGLVLENCRFADDADLCFEYASLNATIIGAVHSIKNPRLGKIVCDSVGEIIIDENCKDPGQCQIVQRLSLK